MTLKQYICIYLRPGGGDAFSTAIGVEVLGFYFWYWRDFRYFDELVTFSNSLSGTSSFFWILSLMLLNISLCFIFSRNGTPNVENTSWKHASWTMVNNKPPENIFLLFISTLLLQLMEVKLKLQQQSALPSESGGRVWTSCLPQPPPTPTHTQRHRAYLLEVGAGYAQLVPPPPHTDTHRHTQTCYLLEVSARYEELVHPSPAHTHTHTHTHTQTQTPYLLEVGAGYEQLVHPSPRTHTQTHTHTDTHTLPSGSGRRVWGSRPHTHIPPHTHTRTRYLLKVGAGYEELVHTHPSHTHTNTHIHTLPSGSGRRVWVVRQPPPPSLPPPPHTDTNTLPSGSGRRVWAARQPPPSRTHTHTHRHTHVTFWKWAQGMSSSSLLTSISSLGISSMRNVLLAMMLRQSSRMSSFCMARILLLIVSSNLQYTQ